MKLMASALALVAVLVMTGFTGCLFDDDPSADRPTWSTGYDWWYSSYGYAEGEGETVEVWGESHQRYVNGTTTVGGVEAYSLIHTDTNNSRLNLDPGAQEENFWSVGSLNPVDAETGEDGVLFKWPLEDDKKWSGSQDNASYNASVEFKEEFRVPAGRFDAFKVTIRFDVITEDNITIHPRLEYYYAEDVRFTIREDTIIEVYENGTFYGRAIERYELLAYGHSDSDGDGISDGGERWLGTNPKVSDTDGDGTPDGADFTPLLDLQVAVELRHFSTSDDCEPLLEENLDGETNGCDVFFIVDNTATTDELETNPSANQDTFTMVELYEVDVPDDLGIFSLRVRAWDEDSSSADDTLDISLAGGEALTLSYDVYSGVWREAGTSNVLAPGEEHSTSGGGGGNYDGTLTFYLWDSSLGPME